MRGSKVQGYREPGFQERVASATRARNSALDKLRARQKADPVEPAPDAAQKDSND
jgi:hypothetical protein